MSVTLEGKENSDIVGKAINGKGQNKTAPQFVLYLLVSCFSGYIPHHLLNMQLLLVLNMH